MINRKIPVSIDSLNPLNVYTKVIKFLKLYLTSSLTGRISLPSAPSLSLPTQLKVASRKPHSNLPNLCV